MHQTTKKRLEHNHDFDPSDGASERRTLQIIILTGVTMSVEIAAGVLTGSMALLADGWHMGTHAFALGITYFAYVMARRYANSAKYAFGTGKFGILSGYTSALFLGATALYMIVESLGRFVNPVPIAFDEAIVVAVIGLLVNLLSLRILHGGGSHRHHPDHAHCSHKHDHNLRAAYLHVMADALTSILAIAALLSGKFFGLSFLDPAMGIVGGLLIAKWSWGLLRSSALILLDGHEDQAVRDAITQAIESDGDSVVSDLHVWPLSAKAVAAVMTVVSGERRDPAEYNARLTGIETLKHVTIETHGCADLHCLCEKP